MRVVGCNVANFEDTATMTTAFTIVGLGESLFDVFSDRAILIGIYTTIRI
jgi:hypothetical protein